MGNQSYGGEGGDSWVTSHLNHIFTGKKDARVFLSDNKLIRRELAYVVQNGNVTSSQLFPRALGVQTAMFFLCLLTFRSSFFTRQREILSPTHFQKSFPKSILKL